jgi:hypothetical protein
MQRIANLLRLTNMKAILTILLTFLVLLAQAITTLYGSIEINKISLTQLTVRYTFILDQQDSVFSADSFSSTIRCVGSSSNINLTNPVELSKTKQFLSCSKTSYKWNIVYGNTLDLGDTKFSAIGACCNLKIDASCGKRSNTISSLSTSLTDFYIYTQFDSSLHSNNCLNQPYYFNQGTLDTANLDSISYRLVAPLSTTGSALSFKSGYYADQPLMPFYPAGRSYPYNEPAANPPIGFYLDNLTGDQIYTSVNATDAGPIAMEMSEWRKDKGGSYQKISTSHIEQFISTSQCPENNPPSINGPYTYKVCEGETLCFNIETEDVTFIPLPPAPIPSPDSVRVSWNNSIPEATFSIINPRVLHPVGSFCWTPEIGQASSLPYSFIVAARDNSCPLNAITRRSFRITVNEKGKANTSYTKDTDSTLAVSTTFMSTRGTHSIKRILMDIDKNPILDNSIARFASSGSYLSVTKNDYIILYTTGVYSLQTEVNNSPLNCPTTYLDTLYYHTAGIQRSDLQRLKIHPNPATSIIYLPFSLDYVIISNSIGQIVREEQHTDVLEIGDLPDGIYYLRGENNQAIYNAKLIKN